MGENDKKPSIRFTGFTVAWEQRKVGELLIERNEQAPMSDESITAFMGERILMKNRLFLTMELMVTTLLFRSCLK